MKASWICALLALFLLCGFEYGSASNILIISTVGSHSHSIWCNKLAQLLVNRGHTVTILDTDPPRKNLTNLTSYTLEGGYDYGEIDYLEVSKSTSPKDAIDLLFALSLTSCRNLHYSPTFKRFLAEHSNKKNSFDLIIHDVTDCENFLGLVPFFGNPKLVLVTPFGDTQALYMMGSQGHMVHSPLQLSPFSHPMSFGDKLKNLFYTLYNYYVYHNYVQSLDVISKETFGESTPHVMEIGKTAAVAFVNAHPIINTAKYYSPAIIPISGFHIDEPKKLDTETQAFLDGAVDGAIYFSLGSNIQSSLMSENKINIFLNVFKKLKQRVLWKFEDKSLKNIPENVRISKWYSQNDVLAHPNTKLFISHNGLLSTQEAIHHAVPMISIPFFLDQYFSATRFSKQGILLPLSYAELSEHSLQQAIEEVLTNTSYSEAMKKWSRIFRDRPVKPKELTAYWIENVLRNDNHEYLKPPETFLSTFELFFFDLKTILGIILGIIVASAVCLSRKKKQNKLKKS